ncbi:hypothetical protein lbkm_2448 [Lachnospiraceae bacterium KM106-2]|nr:hypothetical protein lbkm_2448 [Lachnospiraceae bacterium KM106-2]
MVGVNKKEHLIDPKATRRVITLNGTLIKNYGYSMLTIKYLESIGKFIVKMKEVIEE